MPQESPGYYSALVHYLLITGILVAALWLVRRWLRRRMDQRGYGAIGRVVGMVPLTPASRLFVVAIGSTYYLIPEGQAGEPAPLSPQQVEGLRLDGGESFAGVMAQRRQQPGVLTEQLQRLVQRGGAAR